MHFVLGLSLLLSTIIFWPLGWQGFFLPKFLVATLGLCLASLILICGARPKTFTGRMSKKELTVLIYFLVLAFFTVFSAAPFSSLLGVSESMQSLTVYMLYLAVFAAALQLNKNQWSKLFPFVLAANLAVLFYGFLQVLNLDPLALFWHKDSFLSRPFSTIGNPNWLASFILLSCPVYLHFLQKSRSKYIIYLAILLNALLLILTVSKAGIIALLISLAAFLFFRKKKIVPLAGFVALALIAAFYVSYFYNDSFSLFRSSFGRLVLWQDTLNMLWQWPWGHGIDIFRFFYPQFLSPELWQYEAIDASFSSPHNQFLQLIFEIGILPALFFYGLILNILWPQLKKQNYIAWGLLAYLISNLFSFEVLPNGILFWCLIAYLVSQDQDHKVSVKWQYISGLLFIPLLILSFLTWNHLRADFSYQKALSFIEKNEYSHALENLHNAIKIYPYDRVFLLQTTELLLAAQTDSNKDSKSLLNEAEQHLTQVNKLSSGKDPDLPILQAWLAAKKSDYTLMEEKLKEAAQLNPNSINTLKILIQIFTETGNNEAIKTAQEKLEKLLPTYWNKPETNEGRIFQKNHPWIAPLLR